MGYKKIEFFKSESYNKLFLFIDSIQNYINPLNIIEDYNKDSEEDFEERFNGFLYISKEDPLYPIIVQEAFKYMKDISPNPNFPFRFDNSFLKPEFVEEAYKPGFFGSFLDAYKGSNFDGQILLEKIVERIRWDPKLYNLLFKPLHILHQ